MRLDELEIVIESEKGSLRYGTDWVQKMAYDYGYINDTFGADGDELDVFVGSNLDSELFFAVEQAKENGDFDEHKVMLGFSNIAEAKDAYLANYPEGWDGLKNITEFPLSEFWSWYDNRRENTMALKNNALGKLKWNERIQPRDTKLGRGAGKYGTEKKENAAKLGKEINLGDKIEWMGKYQKVTKVWKSNFTDEKGYSVKFEDGTVIFIPDGDTVKTK